MRENHPLQDDDLKEQAKNANAQFPRLSTQCPIPGLKNKHNHPFQDGDFEQ